jgi:hypothetical protein
MFAEDFEDAVDRLLLGLIHGAVIIGEVFGGGKGKGWSRKEEVRGDGRWVTAVQGEGAARPLTFPELRSSLTL